MKAFLLAAGLGTRLRPLSQELPKPVWPLFDVPIAAHALRAMDGAGVTEVVVNLHHLPGELRRSLAPWIPSGVRVRWSHEEVILGTGGALGPWRDLLSQETFLVANADTYQEIDLGAMVRWHRERGGIATIALRQARTGSRAPVEVDGSGRVVRFLKGRAPGAAPARSCEFTGVHVLEPEIFDHLPEGRSCINADGHQQLVAGGKPVFGYVPPEDGFWSDLGTPALYLGAHRHFLTMGGLPFGSPGSLVLEDRNAEGGGRVRAPSYLGAGARVEDGGVAGPFAVLGSEARVSSRGRIVDSVLWPRAAVGAGELRNTVVSPTGIWLRVMEAF
jgi:mannose-1-phosphate guanylyltransferase